MPTLKQVTTSIELGSSDTRLKEYDHRFTDGAVECFVMAPETDIPFHVRITTSGYIAPGLAAYVFIDGEYQCNRNRLRLEVPADGVDPAEYEIVFKLRQKEEKTSSGNFVVRDWFFTPLKTGIADSEPNMSRDWAKNVGTIEVVILRCKQGGEKETAIDPADTVVATAPPAGRDLLRAIGSRKQSLNKGTAPKAKEPSKEPSKTPSKAPSRNNSVAQSEDMLGGMMGIFDGAGDDPGYYKQYRPKNIVGQTYRPAHRFDDTTGRYRYYEDDDPFVRSDTRGREERDDRAPDRRYQPYTYTVAGGFDDNDRTPSTRSGPKRLVPRTSPSPVTSEGRRRRGVVFDIPTRSSTHHTTAHSERDRSHDRDRPYDRERPHEEPRGRPSRTPSAIVFIREASDHMEGLLEVANDEVKKYQDLWKVIDDFKSDTEVHTAMLKTVKRKYDEIQEILEDLGKENASITVLMEKLDRMEWKQAYDMLFEKGLMPPPKIVLRLPDGTEPEPKKEDDNGKKQDGKKDDGWLEVGAGTVDEKDKSADAKTANNDPWLTADTQPTQPDNSNPDGVNPDFKSSHSKDDAKSGSKKSTTSGWGDGSGAKNDAADGWGNTPDAANDSSWEQKDDKPEKSKPRSRAAFAANNSTTPSNREPHAEIKSYWKDWSKKPESASKMRVPFRDPYKYPAMPIPAVPASKAGDIKHGVSAGRGADYAHKHYRPEYLDTMEKPYAVFTFKYRSKEALQKIAGGKIDERDIELAVKGEERERLMRTPKDELVAELLRKRGVPGTKSHVSAAAKIKAKVKGTKKKDGEEKEGDGGWEEPAKTPSKAGSGWGPPDDGKGKSQAGGGWDVVKPSDSVSQADGSNGWFGKDKDLKKTGGSGFKPDPAGTPDGGAGGW